MKKGFDRLRGVAAASAMGLGLLGGAGSVRAVSVTTKTTVGFGTFSHTTGSGGTTHLTFATPTEWWGIGNLTNMMGNQSITTAGGFALTAGQSAFGISEARHRFYPHIYAGAMFLAVGNNLFVNPDNTVDLTDKNLTTDTVVDIVPGVDAQIQYQFYSPELNSTRPGGVVRALYSVTNTTGVDISTSMLVMGNYYDDAKTTVQGTSDGDLIVEASDYWVASNNFVGDTPEYAFWSDTVISSHGAGAAVVPVVAMTLGSPTGGSGMIDNFGYRYDVTIPAGETVRVMLFNEVSVWMTDALAAAPDFESLDAASAAGLLTGLSPTQLSEIVNYGTATDTDSDGVADNADAFPLNIAASVDADNDGLPDAWNAACDENCQTGSGLLLDTSLDDTDNDGVINGNDAFPNDATETLDTDGDGVGDNADAFPNDETETVDTDGDGVGDNADAFPNDPTETLDTDGDGVGDNADAFPNDASRSVATSSSSSGATSLPALFALLGVPALLRRRKNKTG